MHPDEHPMEVRFEPNPGLTTEDVAAAMRRLERNLAVYKRTNRYYDKQEVVGAYIQIMAMKQPVTFNRKSSVGMKNRHHVRDLLHDMEEEKFLRTVSEILWKEFTNA